MKIIDILKEEKVTLSFEVFPPKKEANFDSVKKATEEIAALHPAFMSVTYGAGGGTSDYTLAIARNIEKNYGVPALAHLTCVSSTRGTVREQITAMHAAGIENVMALRGDLQPGMETQDRRSWDYRYASELVQELRSSGVPFCIGGACYPEIHPESSSRKEDIRHLHKKVDAGCDFLTTQMFFDNKILYNFLDDLRAEGIYLPVVAGIMPITTRKQAERSVQISGSYMPQNLQDLVERFGDDSAAMQQAGIAYAVAQIIDLIANGVNHIHVYTMNKPEVARQIQACLQDLLGR